jgi:CelD/BcsL family acetyltransferase involved in cellulose biosynthesis
VTAIKLNGEFIAMHWGIFAKNYYYYLLPSMKEGRFKRFSPGKLLLSILVRWAISKKIDFFDFGLGEESYKKKWSNKKENIYSYIRLNKLKGIFYYITIKIVKTIILFKKNINR